MIRYVRHKSIVGDVSTVSLGKRQLEKATTETRNVMYDVERRVFTLYHSTRARDHSMKVNGGKFWMDKR